MSNKLDEMRAQQQMQHQQNNGHEFGKLSNSANSDSKTRILWFMIAAVCGLSMAYALYTEHVQGLTPCNLCMLQRGSISVLGIIAFVSFLHNPSNTIMKKIYSLLASLAALSGVILAGRHVWLQHLPEDKIPACGPPFDYLVSQFPITEVIQEIFTGSGDCAEIQWQFLGFSMPEVLLGVFTALFAACLYQFKKAL